MAYTDNPIADFLSRDRELERLLKRLPVCAECGEPIQDDECYEFDGKVICPECLEDNHRHWTEDLIEY